MCQLIASVASTRTQWCVSVIWLIPPSENLQPRVRLHDNSTIHSYPKGGIMNNLIQRKKVAVGMCVLTVIAFPMSSAAWHQIAPSISSTDVPIVMVLNEDQLKGKWKQ